MTAWPIQPGNWTGADWAALSVWEAFYVAWNERRVAAGQEPVTVPVEGDDVQVYIALRQIQEWMIDNQHEWVMPLDANGNKLDDNYYDNFEEIPTGGLFTNWSFYGSGGYGWNFTDPDNPITAEMLEATQLALQRFCWRVSGAAWSATGVVVWSGSGHIVGDINNPTWTEYEEAKAATETAYQLDGPANSAYQGGSGPHCVSLVMWWSWDAGHPYGSRDSVDAYLYCEGRKGELSGIPTLPNSGVPQIRWMWHAEKPDAADETEWDGNALLVAEYQWACWEVQTVGATVSGTLCLDPELNRPNWTATKPSSPSVYKATGLWANMNRVTPSTYVRPPRVLMQWEYGFEYT